MELYARGVCWGGDYVAVGGEDGGQERENGRFLRIGVIVSVLRGRGSLGQYDYFIRVFGGGSEDKERAKKGLRMEE